MLYEMSPFILLLTIQLFFIKLFENQEIDIFKYSSKIQKFYYCWNTLVYNWNFHNYYIL